MSNDKLPIKFFAPREIDEMRVEAGGNSDLPKWVLSGEKLVQRSAELTVAFDSLEVEVAKKKANESAVPFVFIAKMSDDSTSKSRRKDISSIFQVGAQSNVIGLASTDELIVKLNSVAQMKEISSRLQDYERNSYAISCLQDFWGFEPIVAIQEGQISYKAKLIDFQDYELNIAMQRLLERTLRAKKIDFKKTDYSEQLPIYKFIHVSQTGIDSIKESDVYEALFSIEPMPKYFLSLDSFTAEEQVEVMKPQAGYHYTTVGVLDNGISAIPHLAPWVVDKRWTVYPESSINPTHGTFVAGVALYGDLLDKNDWIGHGGFKILDAAVFPDTSKEGLDEDELIANIKEAVAANHKQVKIWNLSISIARPVSDKKFSDFAIALDFIQDQYNVIICKSAGNCMNFTKSLPKGRIHEGADSIRSLVVGSVAHTKGEYDFADIYGILCK